MSAARGPARLLEGPARALVWSVRGLVRYRLVVSSLGLVVTLLAGAAYLIFGALQLDPLRSQIRIHVELAQSGGLQAGQDVTLRGVPIGRVESVDVSGDKVIATAHLDRRTRIPANGEVQVADLSAAGEQHLDFVPATDTGPYLSDGAVITADRTSTGVTMATMLGDLNGTVGQIDPAELSAVIKELGVSAQGPAKLSAILGGGMFMVSTLDSVLPQTVSLLHNSKTVLTTLGQAGPSLRTMGHDLAATSAGVGSMTGGYATLLDNTPGLLQTTDSMIADNSPTMVELLGNLVTVSQMTYAHIPALRELFFPQQRAGSTLDAITGAVHGNAIWALASPYPRQYCDYNVPRRPGAVPNFPEPYLNARCTDSDPTLLPRGAANAPRPPGDNTALAPPGADPLATADPTPRGPYTIPTPYGAAENPPPPPPGK